MGFEKRILITGGAGFIGSHLARSLLNRGDRVTVLDDLSTGAFANIAPLIPHPRFSYVIDSVTNESELDTLVCECDLVFHLAAAVGVKLLAGSPVSTIETNVMGTRSVLEAASRHMVKVLVASSSEVYGKSVSIPFQEDADVTLGATSGSRWAYANSKLLKEHLALAYHREKGLPVVIFRPFNTVGPMQTGTYGMVVPRFVRQALGGEDLTVYGNGRQTRCFLHVQDAVEAIIALEDCPEAVGEVFNVGSTEEVLIVELAQKVLELVAEVKGLPTNKGDMTFIPFEEAYTVGFEDIYRRKPDISKIRKFTGWYPKYRLDNILRDVIADSSDRELSYEHCEEQGCRDLPSMELSPSEP